jgi:hypothetical protein
MQNQKFGEAYELSTPTEWFDIRGLSGRFTPDTARGYCDNLASHGLNVFLGDSLSTVLEVHRIPQLVRLTHCNHPD